MALAITVRERLPLVLYLPVYTRSAHACQACENTPAMCVRGRWGREGKGGGGGGDAPRASGHPDFNLDTGIPRLISTT